VALLAEIQNWNCYRVSGRVIAHLVLVVSSTRAEAKITAVLADMNQLSAEISARWPGGVMALEAVNDVRREL
jgi:hypothetical protein